MISNKKKTKDVCVCVEEDIIVHHNYLLHEKIIVQSDIMTNKQKQCCNK